jgi:hypothetical protein
MLLSGRCITHRDFLVHAGSYRLAGYIRELREKGWPIRTIERDKPTSDPRGRRATVAEYHLPADAIADADERGRRFVESMNRWEVARTVAAARDDRDDIGSGTPNGRDSTGPIEH